MSLHVERLLELSRLLYERLQLWTASQVYVAGWWQVQELADGSKTLKLGDFGLATIADQPLYAVCGTPTYIAPEVLAEVGLVHHISHVTDKLHR